MREIKSVKVDNWGVFFLQKLQNFFNKTDYCDLTLQFKDNSQLKVHRLVLSACTDYFNVLEQTCEVVDDVLIMPAGLQADVIVPIVNFMYTGTLEFEIDMYGRLLKTARDMNMTVLLKLLEAHKRTVDSSRAQSQLRRVPKSFVNRRTPNPPRVERNYPAHSITVGGDHRRTVPVSSHQLKTLQIKHVSPSTSYYQTESATKYVENTAPAKGPSRFEYSDETTLPPDSFEQFDSISYESKPLITANQVSKEDIDDYDNLIPAHDTSSTFEQLRKSYTSNKRPSSSVSSFGSPPEKKPNIQDVKEYAEQQRMRKQITAEYDDENEYDEVLDDAFPNDDDDEDYVPPVHLQKTMRKHAPALVIKQEKDQKPTIVVKDTVGSNVNHAKIISEVLKKYPHLVKNNKNIKLKIMAKSGTSPNQQQSIVIKQEPETEFIPTSQPQPAPKTITVGAPRAANIQTSLVKQPVQMQKTIAPQPTSVVAKPQQPAPQKLTTTTKIVTQKVPVTTNPAPRRIDSKTMHSLIALGAENTSGPWLCLRCGVNGRPISIPSYRGFRRHLINIHKEKINSRLCEHCGWRSGNDAELYHHMRVQHDILPPARYNFPACLYCPSIFLDKASFDQHMRETHPDKITYRQQCMYCDEVFIEESDLFTHMNTQHKAQAHKDGLIDYTDDEDTAFYGSEGRQATDKKIKILSSITISPQSAIKPETSKLGAAALGSVATGIATSLGLIDSTDSQEIQFLDSESAFMGSVSGSSQEPKFVNADGQIMELTQEQRDEIMSQLQNQAEGGVVMVLNQDSFAAGAVSSAEDTAKLDNSDESLLVAMPDEQTEQKVSDEKETVDGDEKMDWQADAAQEISGPDVAKPKDAEVPEKNDDEAAVKTEEEKDAVNTSIEDNEADNSAQTEEESSANKKDENEKLEKAKEKLKLLAGDWSDDEDENDETIETTAEDTANTSKQSESIEPAEEAANDQDKSLDEEKEIIFETVTAVPPDDKDELPHKPADESKNDDSAAEVDQVAETEAIAEENREEEEVETESTTEARQKDNEQNANDAVVKETETEVKIESEADTSIAEEVPEKELDKEKGKSKKVSDDNKAKKEDQTDDHIQSLISDWGEEEDEDL